MPTEISAYLKYANLQMAAESLLAAPRQAAIQSARLPASGWRQGSNELEIKNASPTAAMGSDAVIP
jgi:hypothetical protein